MAGLGGANGPTGPAEAGPVSLSARRDKTGSWSGRERVAGGSDQPPAGTEQLRARLVSRGSPASRQTPDAYPGCDPQ